MVDRGTSATVMEKTPVKTEDKGTDCLKEIYSFQKKVHDQLEKLKSTPPSVCDKESWIRFQRARDEYLAKKFSSSSSESFDLLACSGDKQTESMVKLAKLCTDVLNGKLRSHADKAVEAKLSSSAVTSGQSNTSRSAASSLAGKGSTTEDSVPSVVDLRRSKSRKPRHIPTSVPASSVAPGRTKNPTQRWQHPQQQELPSMKQQARYDVYPPPPVPSMCAAMPVYGDVVPNPWYPAGRTFSPTPYVINNQHASVALPALQTYSCWPSTMQNEVQSFINRQVVHQQIFKLKIY